MAFPNKHPTLAGVSNTRSNNRRQSNSKSSNKVTIVALGGEGGTVRVITEVAAATCQVLYKC